MAKLHTGILGNLTGSIGDLNFYKWKELALGFSPEVDYNLYGGILVLP